MPRILPNPSTTRSASEAFRAENICLPRPTGGLAVDHVSLSVKAGEILGIYGLMGAGRSEFFECVIGRHAHSTGKIFVDGEEIRAPRHHRGVSAGPCAHPGRPAARRPGAGPVDRLQPDAGEPWPIRKRLFHIDRRREKKAIEDAIRDLSIKAPNPDFEVTSMSGGNQQKVVIGKALMTNPKVLLMDEPSRGIDVGAKADVFRTMRRLAGKGLAILFSTSDLEEVMALSDRIAVMSNGQLVAVFDRADATEEAIIAALRPRDTDIKGNSRHDGGNRINYSPPKARHGSILLTLMKLRTFIALFAVIIFFSIFAPNFTSTANMILMSKHVALNAFLAMGMTFVIITGGIDLSVGSIVGLCGMVAGGLILYGIELPIGYTVYFNLVEVVLITLASASSSALINGLLITKLNVAPFIATLGTLYVARGLALLSSDGQTFPNLVGQAGTMQRPASASSARAAFSACRCRSGS